MQRGFGNLKNMVSLSKKLIEKANNFSFKKLQSKLFSKLKISCLSLKKEEENSLTEILAQKSNKIKKRVFETYGNILKSRKSKQSIIKKLGIIYANALLRLSILQWKNVYIESQLSQYKQNRAKNLKQQLFIELKKFYYSRVHEIKQFSIQTLKRKAFKAFQIGCYTVKLNVFIIKR